MRAGSVCFLLGILVFTRLAELPPVYYYLMSPVCLGILARYRLIKCLGWALLGFLWAFTCAQNRLAQQLIPELEGQKLMLTGKIVSLPNIRQDRSRFSFQVDELKDMKGRSWASPGRVQLSWYRNAPYLAAGQRWQFQVKLKRPWGFMNPGGFDYEGRLFQDNIRASGYVLMHPGNRLLGQSNGERISRLRAYLGGRISGLLEASPHAALLVTLTTGDRSHLSTEQWRVLKASGTNHLMAISGLHIGFVAVLAFYLSRCLWPLCGPACLYIAAPKMAMLMSILAAACYSALAGFALPTQRALIMLAVFLAVKLFNRRTSSSQVLAVSALIILLIDPFAALSPGFYLSFAALAVILLGMGSRYQTQGLWWRWGRTQWLVAFGLLPILTFWFGEIPTLGIPANLVAVPLVSLCTVPLTLLGSLLLAVYEPLAVFLWYIALASLEWLWPVLQFIAAQELSTIRFYPPSVLTLACAFAGTLILLLPAGIPGRHLGLVCLLPLFFPGLNKLEQGQLRFTVLDVGQGLAAVLQTRDYVLVYDTGAKYSAHFNAGTAVVVPYLKHSGLSHIDKLIISHTDNDHIGGLQGILDEIDVRSVSSSVPLALAGRRNELCYSTQSWQWNGVNFDILHPSRPTALGGNNASCVLRVRLHGTTILLTGDIEIEAERALLARYPEGLKSTVVTAPHHGSRTSSSPAFLDATRPDIVVFPVGYRNRFGFPKQDIMRRYRIRGSRLLDTAYSGAIEFEFSQHGLSFSEYRRESRRFWHSTGPSAGI